MLRYEDFPKKCLKCKKSDVPLEKFQVGYAKTKSTQGNFFSRVQTTTSRGYSVKFPVCKTCKKQFKRFLILRKSFYIMILLNLFTLLLTILFTFVPPHINFPFNILPITITFIPTLVLAIIFRIYPHKIKNYIELTENGVLIKDPNYKKELYDYNVSRNVEDALYINKVTCPYCGSLIRKEADFCLSCGKDLRQN